MGFSFFASSPAFDINDKIVIITGASSGIGRALAEETAQQGAKVVLAARTVEELEKVAQSLPGGCDKHLVVKMDVSKESDCKLLIQKTIEKYGTLDVLVNNAGITQAQTLEECKDLSRYHEIMDTNYFGTLNCTYYALEYLKASSGMIVAVSSMCGKLGVPNRTGYCASKHAIHGLLDSLRTELIDTGVHILIACPGYVRTDIRSQASDSKDDPINQSNIMSAEECATSIRQAMEQKKREVFVVKTLSASLGPYLRWFLPEYTDRLVISKAKSGNT